MGRREKSLFILDQNDLLTNCNGMSYRVIEPNPDHQTHQYRSSYPGLLHEALHSDHPHP